MTRKDERAEDMPGGIREEEPEEEDAAGAAGERHQASSDDRNCQARPAILVLQINSSTDIQ